jgi:hypothetical protein
MLPLGTTSAAVVHQETVHNSAGSSHPLSPRSQEAALLAELERLDRQLASVRDSARSERRLAFVGHDPAHEGKAPEAGQQEKKHQIRGEFEVGVAGLNREAGGSCAHVRTADADAIRAFADAVKATVRSGGTTGTETAAQEEVGGAENVSTRAPDEGFEGRATSAKRAVGAERAESVRSTSRSGRALVQSVCRMEQPTLRPFQNSHKTPSSPKPLSSSRPRRASEGDALKSRHASCAKPQTPEPFSGSRLRRRSEGALLMREKMGSAPERRRATSWQSPAKAGGAVPPNRRSDSASGNVSAGDGSLQGTAEEWFGTGSREARSGESPIRDCELSSEDTMLRSVPPDGSPRTAGTDGTDGTDQDEDLLGGPKDERNGPERNSTGKNANKHVELGNPPLQCTPVAKGGRVQLPEKGNLEGSMRLMKPRCTFVKLSELAAKRGRAVSYTEERHVVTEGRLGLATHAEVLSGDSRYAQGLGAVLRYGGDLGGDFERTRAASCTEGFRAGSGDKLNCKASVGNGTFAVQWPDEGVGSEKGFCLEEELQEKAAGESSSQAAEDKKKVTKDSMQSRATAPQAPNRAETCSSKPVAERKVWPVGIPEEDWGVFLSGRETASEGLPRGQNPDPGARASTTSFEGRQAELLEVKCGSGIEIPETSPADMVGMVQRAIECSSDDLSLRAECARLPRVRMCHVAGRQGRLGKDERLSEEGHDSGSPQRARARDGVSGFWQALGTPAGSVNMGKKEDCQQTGEGVSEDPKPSLGAATVTEESAGVIRESGGLLGMPVESQTFSVAAIDGRMRRVSVDSFDELGWGGWHSAGEAENLVEKQKEKQGAVVLQNEYSFEADPEQVAAEGGRVRGLSVDSLAALIGESWHVTEAVGMAVGRDGTLGEDSVLETGGADPGRFAAEIKEGRVRWFSIDSIEALGGEMWQSMGVEEAGEIATNGSLKVRSAQEGNGTERKTDEEEADGKANEAVRIVEDSKQKAAGAERNANEVEQKDAEVERKVGEAGRQVNGTDRKTEEFAEAERIAAEEERKSSAGEKGEGATPGIKTPADAPTETVDGREEKPRPGCDDWVADQRVPVAGKGTFPHLESTQTRADSSGGAELWNGPKAFAGSVSQLVAHFDFLQTESAVHVSGANSVSCMRSQRCVDESSSLENGAMGTAEFAVSAAVDVDIDAVRNGAEPIWVQWERELLDESQEGSPLGDGKSAWGAV